MYHYWSIFEIPFTSAFAHSSRQAYNVTTIEVCGFGYYYLGDPKRPIRGLKNSIMEDSDDT
jgi:hypothetical protein